jgi:ATP-dependent DNA helicase RecG
MHNRDHIIKLGRVLAEEQRRGYDDGAVAEGLALFLYSWEREAKEDSGIPVVRGTLDLLAGYNDLPGDVRQERVDHALTELRALFKKSNGATNSTNGATGEETGAENPAPARSVVPLRNSVQPKLQPKAAAKAASAPAATGPLQIDDPVGKIPNVGRQTAASFHRLGLHTVRDLLYHFPHRYDDFSSQRQIADLEPNATETVVAEVIDGKVFSGKRHGVEIKVGDESGILRITFFGARQWLLNQLPVGRKIVVSGKVTLYQGVRQMSNPSWEPYAVDELVHTGRMVPVHSLTAGLHERNARTVIKQVVDMMAPKLPDFLPSAVRERAGLVELPTAIIQAHFPENKERLEQARTRLGFDEFLLIQIGVVQRKMLWQGERGHPLVFHEEVHQDLLSRLPFALTGAQQRALDEIFADMRRPVPMARLLQGDVGSGKTVVAASALLQAVANGFQGALMAPTEILAEQHYKGLRNLMSKVRVPRTAKEDAAEANGPNWQEELDPEQAARLAEIKSLLGMTVEDDMGGEGVRVALLTGSLGVRERRRVLEGIASSEIDIIVGTHALITETVQYQSLGLVCIDEQHRFGVEQRNRLKDKGFNPHMLVMTATPIPRTLTMTIYGDLDVSVLDELPPGRQEIRTRWVKRTERDKAYRHMRKEISKGRQAFVICPLVEESEKIDLPSAEEMYETLQSEVFPDLKVGLIHGKLLPREKDEVMLAFRDKQFDILVATAVIEVGIDVPNATTIVIDGAERFGLSQLHQFRGRVGRGIHQSYCILISDKENDQTKQRLEAMENTTDGFKLAELDLQVRGPGEFFGRRQSGTPDLKIAQLGDTRLLYAARTEAQKILADDPKLEKPEHALLRQKVEQFWADAEGAS